MRLWGFAPGSTKFHSPVEIELPIDDRERFRIDIRNLAGRDSQRAIPTVLWAVPVWIGGKQVAVRRAGEEPAGIPPRMLEFAFAPDRFAVGEVRNGVVALDRDVVLGGVQRPIRFIRGDLEG